MSNISKIKNGIRNPSKIIPFIILKCKEKEKDALIKYFKNRKIIWHFCTPKCASTSFLYRIKKYAKNDSSVKSISPRCFGQNRPQVIDVQYIKKQMRGG